jgi:predicted aspartyl protease
MTSTTAIAAALATALPLTLVLALVAGLSLSPALAASPAAGPQKIAPQAGPAPELRFAGDQVELPMTDKNGRSVVAVYIGDAGPFDFFIDTGAGISVIDARIASELGLEVVGSMPVGAPGGKQVKADRLRIPELRAAGLEVRGVSPVSLEIAEMTGGIMQGILGLDVFQEVLLTLDPAAHRAILSRAGLAEGDPGVVPLDMSRGRIQFDMKVAGKTVTTQVDSGAPAAFTLPIELIDSVPTHPGPEQTRSAGLVGGSRTVKVRKLNGAITFAGLEYQDPQVGFMDPSPGTAHIGAHILDDLVLSVDQKNHLLAFQQPERSRVAKQATAETPATAPAGPRRLGVRFRGNPPAHFTEVASVDAGSLGERYGLQAGDQLVSLNGVPMADYNRGTLGSLIAGTELLRWVIERNGVRKTIEIP